MLEFMNCSGGYMGHFGAREHFGGRKEGAFKVLMSCCALGQVQFIACLSPTCRKSAEVLVVHLSWFQERTIARMEGVGPGGRLSRKHQYWRCAAPAHLKSKILVLIAFMSPAC